MNEKTEHGSLLLAIIIRADYKSDGIHLSMPTAVEAHVSSVK